MKEKITTTAIKLFETKGYEETTIKDICDTLKIAKGTFYYHFQTKSDIIYHFYEKSKEKFNLVLMKLLEIDSPRDKLWEITNFNIDYCDQLPAKLSKAFYQADIERGFRFFNPFTSTDVKNYQKEIGIKLIQKGQELKVIKPGNPEEMLYTFFSAQYGIALSWAFSDASFDKKKEIKRVFNVIF